MCGDGSNPKRRKKKSALRSSFVTSKMWSRCDVCSVREMLVPIMIPASSLSSSYHHVDEIRYAICCACFEERNALRSNGRLFPVISFRCAIRYVAAFVSRKKSHNLTKAFSKSFYLGILNQLGICATFLMQRIV